VNIVTPGLTFVDGNRLITAQGFFGQKISGGFIGPSSAAAANLSVFTPVTFSLEIIKIA
jgi:hypothetical protein